MDRILDYLKEIVKSIVEVIVNILNIVMFKYLEIIY